MSNRLNWSDNDTNTERNRQVYNFVNWLMYEMQDGKVEVMNVPISIAFVKMAENGDIDEVTASEHAEMFLAWQENTTYNIGDLRRYGEGEPKLYKCLQAHTSQANWTPDVSPSLWKAVGFNEEGIPYWSQPISQQDSYMKDAEVVNPDDGFVWVSDLDYNVWKPGVYGWHLKK
jgi:hypothetical protein